MKKTLLLCVFCFLPLVGGNAQNLPQIDMVFVEGGSFTAGTNEGSGTASENPAHAVTLSDFYIGKYEVSQALWEAVTGNNPSQFKNCPDCPVESVSRADCLLFIEKLNALSGETYRLPTEAEWEYAAKGGKKSKKYIYAGSHNLGEAAWNPENAAGKTHPVGQKKGNELNLYDMNGNVWEWCMDTFDEKFYEKPEASGQDPVNLQPSQIYSARGGSWLISFHMFRPFERAGFPGDLREAFLGLRLVKQP